MTVDIRGAKQREARHSDRASCCEESHAVKRKPKYSSAQHKSEHKQAKGGIPEANSFKCKQNPQNPMGLSVQHESSMECAEEWLPGRFIQGEAEGSLLHRGWWLRRIWHLSQDERRPANTADRRVQSRAAWVPLRQDVFYCAVHLSL